jgi:hypothetical protein
MNIEFEWDPVKAKTNLRKHGVNFADAATVFEDETVLTIEDPDAEGERRYVTVGRDAVGQVLTVVYTCRAQSIRIISARKATKHERQAYEEEN